MIEGELGFKIVKDLGAHDELLALAATLPLARAAYEAAVKMYPDAIRRAAQSWPQLRVDSSGDRGNDIGTVRAYTRSAAAA